MQNVRSPAADNHQKSTTPLPTRSPSASDLAYDEARENASPLSGRADERRSLFLIARDGMLQLGFNNVCPLGTLLTVYAKLTLPLQWSPRQPVKRALLGLEPQLRQKPVADHSTALT